MLVVAEGAKPLGKTRRKLNPAFELLPGRFWRYVRAVHLCELLTAVFFYLECLHSNIYGAKVMNFHEKKKHISGWNRTKQDGWRTNGDLCKEFVYICSGNLHK